MGDTFTTCEVCGEARFSKFPSCHANAAHFKIAALQAELAHVREERDDLAARRNLQADACVDAITQRDHFKWRYEAEVFTHEATVKLWNQAIDLLALHVEAIRVAREYLGEEAKWHEGPKDALAQMDAILKEQS